MNEKIISSIDEMQEELISHNQFMYEHPELAFEEFETSKHLMAWALTKEFEITKGEGLLQTAFVASKKVGKGGKCIAFIAEFDALKGLGHACGHNLIATMSFGAAFALATAAQEKELDCEIKIIGAPAEECGGGKIHMLNQGFFDGVDCAMMIHPSDRTMVEDFSFANQIFKYQYFGSAAHASAAPWEGANAVEGMLQTLNLINGLRSQMKDYSRVNPLIVSSGRANNVIPDYAEMEVNIRSVDNDYLNQLIEDVHRCAEKSAEVYKLDFKMEEISLRYASVSNNPILESIMKKHFNKLGEEVMSRPRNTGVGSTDMGNVTQKMPAIHGHLRISEGLKTHTEAFREAVIGIEGKRAMLIGAKAMALTGYELITEQNKFDEMQNAFNQLGGKK